jgi:AAA15 family ATPase/GTPase
MTSKIFLDGIALKNYRGIGDGPMLVGPFKRFNFMIGSNNAGKSTVLNAISKHATKLANEKRLPDLLTLEVHLGKNSHSVKLGVAKNATDLVNETLVRIPSIKNNPRLVSLLKDIVTSLSERNLVWFTPTQNGTPQFELWTEVNIKQLRQVGTDADWENLWQLISGRSGGGILEHWVPESLNSLIKSATFAIPTANMIPAKRQISPKGTEFKDWTGTGLIDELASLQSPRLEERKVNLSKYKRINDFLESVTENLGARIEIPHDREHILVHMDGKVLPLDSLGTGIHEVVLLAAFCTIMDEQIVCMEEPESHLHPLIQRKLIEYLEKKTTNQYFIATHSASIIDSVDAAIFHVTNKDGMTNIGPAITVADRFQICRELGYKASDLLQTNFIIWVEGPSDRIYLNHWIRAVEPSYNEGMHYSIMFYGGKLLNHLTGEETERDINALIELRKLNQNTAILMDSDRSNKFAKINSTKRRIESEFSDKFGVVWITKGREIENYVSTAIMTAALRSTHASFKNRLATGQFDHALPFEDLTGKSVTLVDKIKVAKAVCSTPVDLQVLDLQKRIRSIVELISAANR